MIYIEKSAKENVQLPVESVQLPVWRTITRLLQRTKNRRIAYKNPYLKTLKRTDTRLSVILKSYNGKKEIIKFRYLRIDFYFCL